MLFVATEVGVLSPESSNSLLNKLYFFRPLDLSYLYSHRDLHDWLSFGPCGSIVLGAFEKPSYSTSKWAAMPFCSEIFSRWFMDAVKISAPVYLLARPHIRCHHCQLLCRGAIQTGPDSGLAPPEPGNPLPCASVKNLYRHRVLVNYI